jgi:hypothetical protein
VYINNTNPGDTNNSNSQNNTNPNSNSTIQYGYVIPHNPPRPPRTLKKDQVIEDSAIIYSISLAAALFSSITVFVSAI